MKISSAIIVSLTLFSLKGFSQIYSDNEDGQYQDMLTPVYYNSSNGDPFRNEVNMFVHFARLESFQNPLKDSVGQMPIFTIHREFGEGIGSGGTTQHHPAIDMYVGNSDSVVNLFAVYDGYCEIYHDSPKYRNYLTISKNINDSIGNYIGKMVVIYAHIDLDKDSINGLLLSGQFVNQGDIVSKYLYSGTVGGPHLHFEIRYYRSTDLGNEDYYGWSGGSIDYTDPSAGPWPYGYWNPYVGYGFANPENYLNNLGLSIASNNLVQGISVYPNPTKDFVIIEHNSKFQNLMYSIYNINGQIVEQKDLVVSDFMKINLSDFVSGIYMIELIEKEKGDRALARVIKE